jgi:hypothetical protein
VSRQRAGSGQKTGRKWQKNDDVLGGGLEGEHARVGRHHRAVEDRVAVHVLRRVLQIPLALVVVADRVDRNGLEGGKCEGEVSKCI